MEEEEIVREEGEERTEVNLLEEPPCSYILYGLPWRFSWEGQSGACSFAVLIERGFVLLYF